MKSKKIISAAALIAAVGLSGCSTTRKASDSEFSLCQSKWGLTTISKQAIDSSSYATEPYIIFDENGSFSGNFGCNTFFGTFYTKKQKLQLEYNGSTKRLCQTMDLENNFQKSLKKGITSYEISDSTLILYAGNEEIFRFKYQGEVEKEEQGE